MNNQQIVEQIISEDEEFIWYATGSLADVKYNPVYWILTIVTLGFWLISLYYKRTFNAYVLTNQRLIRISGIVTKRVDEIELFRIINSVTHQDVLERLAGIGGITIDSTDGSGTFDMQKVPNPYYLRDTLRQQYMLARQKKGTVLLESSSNWNI
ncbi:MAG: PH domain-containing protein [Alphaproteobacteria bacterium]|nr:PH domain-containing protein [Alphaproteobacteria bacterium]